MVTNKQIWKVSYPIFLSLLAQNVINVTDTAFLGRVGEVELGASAIGGLFYICAYTIAFGFSTGSQIVIARRNGEKRFTEVGPVMMQGVFFLLGMASCMFFISRIWGEEIMKLLISSPIIHDATMDYLDWRVFGFFFSFVSVMFRAFFIGITRTKVLTLNAIVMALTNIVLDYLFIFGKGGFPQMGIKGAAIASVIAEVVSILFFVVYTRMTVDMRKYGFDHFRSFDFGLLRRVLGISVFTMLQYFMSMGTFFFFFVVTERIGQRELAIANIVRSVYIVLYIPIGSLSTATNSLVSNMIGAGHADSVLRLIAKISRWSIGLMAIFVAITCLIPKTIVSIYTNDPQLAADSVPSLYIIGIAMLICSVSNIVFNGVSGTGNTRSALAMELVTLVFYCVYLYIVGVLYKLPTHICFITEIVYYSFLMIFSMLYLRKGTWKLKKI